MGGISPTSRLAKGVLAPKRAAEARARVAPRETFTRRPPHPPRARCSWAKSEPECNSTGRAPAVRGQGGGEPRNRHLLSSLHAVDTARVGRDRRSRRARAPAGEGTSGGKAPCPAAVHRGRLPSRALGGAAPEPAPVRGGLGALVTLVPLHEGVRLHRRVPRAAGRTVRLAGSGH